MDNLCFIDIETDDLDASVVWCAVTYTEEDGYREWTTKEDLNVNLAVYLKHRILVGHNILGFDLPVLQRLCGVSNKWGSCIDTLVVSRLRNSWDVTNHSLEAWGERLGVRKQHFDDFSKFTPEMLKYCKQDVAVLVKLYKKLEPYITNPRYKKALALEHNSAYLCKKIEDNGFQFNLDKALTLYNEVLDYRQELVDELQRCYPPTTQLEREIIPRATKSGSISKTDFRWLDGYTPEEIGCNVGSPFSTFSYRSFNPNSTKDRVEALWAAGWKPVEKTDGHIKAIRDGAPEERLKHFEYYGWKVNEANLATLPEDAPEGSRKLAEYLTIDSRRSTLEEWFKALREDDRIHPKIRHIGAWTHRKAHSNPNCANIPSIAHEVSNPTPVQKINIMFNARMRECWEVPENKVLVGVDADAIQLRILAHEINNKEYINAIHVGKKEDETDIHNVNRRALQLDHLTRDHAKTFIYAWLLGAGVDKVASILNCNQTDARAAMGNFLESIDGLAKLKYSTIPRYSERRYFVGVDGRPVVCDQEHFILAGILQANESIIMKWANRLWTRQLDREKVWYKQVNDVHDEWQTECYPQDAEYILKVQADSIRIAGEELELNCPLAGSGSIGRNWRQTH